MQGVNWFWSFQQLTFLLKVMVTNVTSLLKTVKAVEDEATKGTRALESTIEHIRQELAVSKKNKKSKTQQLTFSEWLFNILSINTVMKVILAEHNNTTLRLLEKFYRTI